MPKNLYPPPPPPPPPIYQSTRDHHGDTTPTLSNSLRRNPFDAGRKPVITSTHYCATLAAQCARETTSVSGQSSSKTEDRTTQREKKQNIQDGIRRLNLCPKWSIIQCNQKTPDRFYDVTFLFSPAPLVVHCANWRRSDNFIALHTSVAACRRRRKFVLFCKFRGLHLQDSARFVGWIGRQVQWCRCAGGCTFWVCTRRQVQLGGRTEHYNTSQVKKWPQCPFQSISVMMEWNLFYSLCDNLTQSCRSAFVLYCPVNLTLWNQQTWELTGWLALQRRHTSITKTWVSYHTLIQHASKHTVHQLWSTPPPPSPSTRALACQMRDAVGDSGLCSCVCVTSFGLINSLVCVCVWRLSCAN